MLGAGALLVAGLGFGAFWGAGLLAFDAPWSAGLALHGLWMGSLGIGIIRLVQPLRGTAAAVLVAGALLLVASLPLEGRFEGSGTPEPGTPAALLFAPAVLLVSIGLILLGVQLLRAKRDQVQVTPVPQPAAGA